MDVHQPPDVDRRRLGQLTVGALLLGVAPVSEDWSGGGDVRARLSSLQQLTANLAAAYDEAGASKVAAYVPKLRTVASRIITDKGVSEPLVRDAKAEYGKLLTILASAQEELGDHAKAIESGTMAASVAQEIGDTETEGHAWRWVSFAHLESGRKRVARNIARRGQRAARNWPSGIGSLLTESLVQARVGDKYAVFELVTRAERAHDGLPESDWGNPGYEFGTLHPAIVRASAGMALAGIGLFHEAMPRLEEAAEIYSGTPGGQTSYVRLVQARCLLGMRDTDGALELASVAVAQEASRPSAWAARHVRDLDKFSRSPRMSVGPFSDLVRQVDQWGYGATAA